MSRFPSYSQDVGSWVQAVTEVSQNDSDEQNRRIRILDQKTVKSYTSEQRDLLVNPNVGAIIYNTNTGVLQTFDGNGWHDLYSRPTPKFAHQRTLAGRHL